MDNKMIIKDYNDGKMMSFSMYKGDYLSFYRYFHYCQIFHKYLTNIDYDGLLLVLSKTTNKKDE